MKWIPVEEALPKSQNEYLVTVNFDGDTYVECLHYGKPLMANREVNGECFYDSDDEWGDVVYDTGTEVIAWMPLPEPYKADCKTELRGEWIEGKYDLMCSNCENTQEYEKFPYCPYCGAKMADRKTEPQFDKDINVRSKTEPQTDCSWQKGE